MIQSMTAFASRTGAALGATWAWDMRGVNARGLDLRLRLPDGLDGLEHAARAALAARLTRGNVTLTLRLTQDSSTQPLLLDPAQLDRVLGALNEVQERAFAIGVTLGQATAADVLAQRGVILAGQVQEIDNTHLINTLKADLDVLLEEFCQMRHSEGRALQAILDDQLSRIGALTDTAAKIAESRRPEARAHLTAALQRVVRDLPQIDEARLVQELALLSVKYDVTEEIDRLRAHVGAARDLLDDAAPSGRKLDFLMQEFNREANTLCAKAQSTELTRLGLDLKALIEQMREQIQNVE